MHRIAPALLVLVLASCGGSARTPPRGQRTASDCERLVRHTVDALAAGSGATPDAEQRKEIDAVVAERCTDEEMLAWVNELPDETYACLMRAKVIAEGDACLAGADGGPLTGESPPADDAPPSPKCAAFAGSTEGLANLRGVVRNAAGELVAGATVVAESPALEGSQTYITDEDGAYVIEGLAPGVYHVTAYYIDITAERHCVNAGGGSDVPVDLTLP